MDIDNNPLYNIVNNSIQPLAITQVELEDKFKETIWEIEPGDKLNDFENIHKKQTYLIGDAGVHITRTIIQYFSQSLFKILDPSKITEKTEAEKKWITRIVFNHCVFINFPFDKMVVADNIFEDCTFINTTFPTDFFFWDNCIKGTVYFPCNEYKAQKAFLDKWYPLHCPEEGSFIGWKKAILTTKEDGVTTDTECLVKLEIPADALRSSGFTRKCRASKAKVLDIINLFTQESISEKPHSTFDRNFKYEIGKTIKPKRDAFIKDRFVECGPGIHFYMSKADAINH